MQTATSKLKTKILILFVMSFISLNGFANKPNILFILGDDMGVDALSGYKLGTLNAHTPHLDHLMASGVTFTNVWAAPVCSASRASLLTGKYGINNGVNSVPGILSTAHKSVFKEIKEQSNGAYKTCLVGKWHLSKRRDYKHPIEHGVDDFMGIMDAGVSDYYNWDKIENGKIEKCTTYATSYFTDYAIKWINKQESPWFMWLAHVAPHTPFHMPPKETYSTENTYGNSGKYRAMIESLDYEIGRLIKNIPDDVLENTIIIFLGDNGTPGRIISGFPTRRGKQTIYQGGINVPLFVSGKGVNRTNETEDALINISDFYATFSQFVNPLAFPSGKANDGISFKHLLSDSAGVERSYNYMAMGSNRRVPYDMFAVRNQQYKLMDLGNENYEFYDLTTDKFESNDLLKGVLNDEQKVAKSELLSLLKQITGQDLGASNRANSNNDSSLKYPVVHTGINEFYSIDSKIINPDTENALYWQDAGRVKNKASYTDNGDNTITDNVTGLMWQKDMGKKLTISEAQIKADTLHLGNYDDWRIPTIKELYSLIQFNGRVMGSKAITPFIDTSYFHHPFGDVSAGERSIDAQTWSSTFYTGKTMRGDATIFGVNFIDGRIKGYPEFKRRMNQTNKMYFRMVRGNTDYGKNLFTDNGDGTVSDKATGLMWQKADDGMARDWISSIEYCENLELAGYSDWHLPHAKELQSIVDYERSPSLTNSAAIDPVFEISEIILPEGNPGHYPYFWSTTTHLDGPNPYKSAVYVSFGEALGKMRGNLLDVHGAGSQRSDPKSGNPSNYPNYRGPQGDMLVVFNHCRCVRNIKKTEKE